MKKVLNNPRNKFLVFMILFTTFVNLSCGGGGSNPVTGGSGGGTIFSGTTSTSGIAKGFGFKEFFAKILLTEVFARSATANDVPNFITNYDANATERLDPSTYAVALKSVKMGTASGGYTFTFFDSTVDNPKRLDLKTNIVGDFGSTTSHPDPATYDRIKNEIVYVEQTIEMNGSNTKYRLYFSDVPHPSENGEYVNAGDIMIYDGDVWKWYDRDSKTYTTTRPTTNGTPACNAVPGAEAVFRIPVCLTPNSAISGSFPNRIFSHEMTGLSISIPSIPSTTLVRVTADHNVSGTFAFNDTANSNGTFEMPTDFPNTGGAGPLPPVIETVSGSTQ